MKISVESIKHKRPYQEDQVFVEHLSDGDLLVGVADGHGGEETSEYISEHARQIFESLKGTYSNQIELMQKTVERLNAETNDHYSGSTLSMVLIEASTKFAYAAIIGDSPIIIKDASSTIWISPEHNIRSNKFEWDRAIKSGGRISNGYLFDGSKWDGPGLQMSRALGDCELRNVLSREPEVFKIPINSESWILCGSDGLFDPSHESTHAQIRSISDLVNSNLDVDSKDLVNLAIKSGSTDNITSILVRI